MNIPTIKVDPNRSHHYIFGVRINNSIWSEDMGKIFLAYGPIYFTNEDVENYKQAIILSQDKLLHTTINEALDIFNCSDLSHNISGMMIACRANNATMHHFSLEEKISEPSGWFEIFVNNTNFCEHDKKKLKEAKI